MYRDASRSVRCQRTALIQSGPWICSVCRRRWNQEMIVGSSRPHAPGRSGDLEYTQKRPRKRSEMFCRRVLVDRHDRLSRAFDDCPGALDGSRDEILSTRLPGMRPGGIAKARGSPPIARLIIVCSHLKFRPLELLCRIRRISRRGWHVTCSVAARATPMGFPGGVFVAVGLPGVCHGGPGAACPRVARGEATGRSYSPLKLGHY